MTPNIKHILIALLATAAPMALTSCSEDDYYNVDINAVPEAANYQDNVVITVDQETNNATFTFTGKGVYPVWIQDGSTYSTTPSFTKYFRKAGDYTIECKVGNGNGVSQGTITKTFHIDKTRMTGFAGYDYDSDFNLWTKQAHDPADVSFYYAPGWAQQADPAFTFNGSELKLTLPNATTEQWQAQMHVQSHISVPAGELFDGSIIVTSNVDIANVTCKIHPDGDDVNAFYPSEFGNKNSDKSIAVNAGEPKAFFFHDLPAAVDMNNIVWTFDFGGCPDNTEIIIENFVLKKSSDNDGTIIPDAPTVDEPNWVAWDSADNLFFGQTITPSFHYAPGWAQIADPGFKDNGDGSYSITLPEATSDRWQAQVALNTAIAIPDADKEYDFCCTVEINNTMNVMYKLVQTDEGETKHDGNFFFADEEETSGVKKFWRTKVKPAEGPMHAVTLFLDFGGCPAGTEVTVSKIILQEHHD